MTGTDIAKALLAYAEALAMREASATVDLPIRLPDGSDGRASILIGPASQLISRTEKSDGEEIVDEELVARLTALTGRLGISKPVASDEPAAASFDIGELDVLDDGRDEYS